MREQAGVIQNEVLAMLKDVSRLDDRVEKLQRHFEQAGEDVRQVRISADKILRRGEKIEEIEIGGQAVDAELPPPRPRLVGDE
jgi:DNA recombination protein RmuC